MKLLRVFSFVFLITEIYSFIYVNTPIINHIPRTKSKLCDIKMELNNYHDYSNFISSYNNTPIPLITYDDIITNMCVIKKVHISSNSDRIIFHYGDNKKGVFYMNPNNSIMVSKIKFILSQINIPEVYIDHPFNMDNPNYKLYCQPKNTDTVTEKDYEDYIDNYFSNHHIDEYSEYPNDDDIALD